MNNELHNTQDAGRTTRDGFTLIELVVSVALISMVLFFAGSIFKVSIGSYRTATAQAEIMQKLRAITEQLNADFKGLRKDAPMFVWFQLDPIDTNNRFDQIMFFADGDFQSTKQYKYIKSDGTIGLKTVVSNVARIQYCHARLYSSSRSDYVSPEDQKEENASDHFLNIDHRTLARRQNLLTSDPSLVVQWPDTSSTTNFNASFIPKDNNDYEYDTNSISQWQAMTYEPVNNDTIIRTCFSMLSPFNSTPRPSLNFRNGEGLHMLMTEGVSNFTIQLLNNVGANGVLGWTPENDALSSSSFGFYFNIPIPGSVSVPNWSAATNWPRAIKFTFTLYDSKGVFREGQTFTYVVYLDE
jgi:prepilin-type N-terminal cleavage/methylation domain-containing protein